MSNLVLFTNRSGSTVLADLLAYRDKSINLGEGLHSMARDYNYNALGNKETLLYQQFSRESLTRKHHNATTRGSDHIGFFKAKQERINVLKESTEQWTVKENLEKLTLDLPFISHCATSGHNIYLTHRAEIVSQFISKINARYRLEIARYDQESNFIYTNNSKYDEYDTMYIKFHWLHMYVNVFLEQLMIWRIIYEKFKHYDTFKVVSYEREIEPMNLIRLGIDSETVSKYKAEEQHLVPTPHNATKVVVEDDHQSPIAGAWDQALYYINRHQYLVEI